MIPIAFAAKPLVNTQSSAVLSEMSLTNSGLIRIKNGYIQKLGGCLPFGTTLHGDTANIILNWKPILAFFVSGEPEPPFVLAIGTYSGAELWSTISLSHDITPAGYTPTPGTSIGTWTFDIWGVHASLIAAWRGSTLYLWTSGLPISATGILVPVGGTAPVAVNGIFVAAPQQQAFAWGVFSPSILTGIDPLLIAWSDVADITVWNATVTNQAGSFRLNSGSKIVAGIWFNLIGLFWTDLDLWSAQYIGFPLIYGFNRVAQNCGLFSPQAFGILGSVVIWMGQNDFHVYSGGSVHSLICTVRDFIFNTIDRDTPVHCDVNSEFWEVTWRFSQIGAAGKYNAYVKWNVQEDKWDLWADPVGGPANAMWVTAWSDEAVGQPPIGIDYSKRLLTFEFSGNSVLRAYGDPGDVQPSSFYQTGWFYLAEGQEEFFVERIMPDFIFTTSPGGTPSGEVRMTFYFADEVPSTDTDYPVRTYGPYTVTPETPYIIIRGSGRIMRYLVECVSANTFYREGKHMARVSVAGRPR